MEERECTSVRVCVCVCASEYVYLAWDVQNFYSCHCVNMEPNTLVLFYKKLSERVRAGNLQRNVQIKKCFSVENLLLEALVSHRWVSYKINRV